MMLKNILHNQNIFQSRKRNFRRIKIIGVHKNKNNIY